MEEHEKGIGMKDISERLFQGMPRVELEKPEGEKRFGRGMVARLREESGGCRNGTPHGLGELDSPLYTFLGSLESAEPGDVLRQGGISYRVLKAGRIVLGDWTMGLRATLEQKGGDGYDGS